MAQFSGAVKIGDLSDFIAPAQACVVSLQGGAAAPDAKPPAQLLEEEGKVQLQPKSGGFKQTYTANGAADGPVKVSLHDCLACSGCVTSAETVLLEAQSGQEMAARLTQPGAVVVVSVSPQSRASLAALHGLSAADVHARLTTALRRIGVAGVFDLGVAREMALAETAEEFLARYAHTCRQRQRQQQQQPRQGSTNGVASAYDPGPLPMLASACPGWVCYAEKTQGAALLAHVARAKSPQAIMGAIVKRFVAPARGWRPDKVYHVAVMPCYDKKLEAARPEFALGTDGDGPNGNGDGNAAVPEVDACLTTGELQTLLEGWNAGALADAPPTSPDALLPPELAAAAEAEARAAAAGQQPQPQLGAASAAGGGWEAQYAYPTAGCGAEPPLHGGAPGGGSGGYLERVARTAAARLLAPGDRPPPGAPLPLRCGRNPDLRELDLGCGGSSGGMGQQQQQQQQQQSLQQQSVQQPPQGPPLRMAAAYGFRNIQSLVRRIKLGRCDLAYGEVMACPGGCLNGGGQLKPRPGQTAAALLDELELLYAAGGSGEGGGGNGNGNAAAAPTPSEPQRRQKMDVDAGAEAAEAEEEWRPVLSAAARALYRHWVKGAPGSAAARALLHTAYRAREKTALGTVGDW